ncbi:peroxiredoxin-2 isoform X2 [Lingula anatina]|uniref:Thioredoxin peroxidase n=1 Tax=Lingula anatina TaxID=7574 RepID=A0A1S3INH5_LINAN|nr:peroxiredoxin-2 isoform X2 [Lingula anatina]|eukprot:XP_013399451.1 peroxiredoxin-2 isoform X2 [Lingula anatina]
MASIARTARRLLQTSLAPKLVPRVGVITGSQRYLHVTPNRFEAKVQQPAPDFKGEAAVDGAIKELNLTDYRGKYLILLFYPQDFTFVCPTELIAFSDRIAEFHAINTEVIGVSTDSVFSHLAWINTPKKEGGLGECKYPLLSDFKKTIATDYGVLLEEKGVALRGLFLIDPNGLVRHMTVNDLPVGRSVDEALRTVQAFQFVEEHGEVCPANWQPDSPTITPTLEGSREYFTQVN